MNIITLKSKIPRVDLLQWLYSQESNAKVFLALRDHNFSVAGFGNLLESPKAPLPTMDWTLEDFEEFIRSTDDPELRLFVAAPFNLSNENFKFIIPRFEIIQEGNEFNLVFRRWPTETTEEFQAQVNLGLKHYPDEIITIINIKNTPDKNEWDNYFQKAINEINSKRLHKIVLARQTDVETNIDVNPYSLLTKLNHNTYHSLIQWDGESQWISVSPERLFRIEDSYLFTEALAGTKPSGISPADNSSAEKELNNSTKDRDEHQLVIDDILAKLKSLDLNPEIKSRMNTVRFHKLVHFKSEIDAELKSETTVAEILRTLHPTSALGGIPTQQALSWLKSHEPFSRKYYGAPFGIMTNQYTEFFVNIRSARLSHNKIQIFTGCGVVKGSTAENEWLEMDHKIAQYMELLK